MQVHNRLEYLRHLLSSLSVSRGISSCLLVFSHDLWEEEMNRELTGITWAPVTQIFYPFSIQTHANTFPGEEKGDCPRNIKPNK